MSRTDPEGDKKRNLDGTQAWQPEAERPFLEPSLPKIPGITLHHEIARGGMGVVYAGRQDFLDRRVAVKLLSVELGGEAFVQRFQREAKILAGIKHPNIVACHLAGQTDDGQSYLVMEFIDGPSLKKWIGDNGPVPVKAALRATRAVAQALGHAHTLGIIHRDVKPENILLETVTSTALDLTFPFTPKVVDLGLARANTGNAAFGLTSPGSVMGTPATMSPEQFDDPDSVDFRSDIYGIGCALFEMLVGQPAFRAKKLTDIVTAKRARVAPDPSVENPNVPPEVAVLVQCMLAPDREQRPRSYKELDEKLDELMQTIGDAPTPRVIGEETGQTIIAKPSQLRSKSKPPKSQPPSPPKSPPPANPPPSMDKSSPGLLRTAEINFLAEGLGDGAGAANAPPAFRGDEFDGAGPGGASPKGGTVAPQPAAAGSAVAEPPKKKNGVIAVVAVLAVAAAGGGYWMSRPGDDPVKPGPGPGPGGDKPVVNEPDKPKTQPVNLPPTLAIKGPDQPKQKVGKQHQFTLTTEASDPEAKGLSYKWTLPDIVSAKSPTNGASLRMVIDDGLPGLEIPVTCEVTDGTNVEKRTHTIIVDEMGFVPPLAGFTVRTDWRRADRLAWTQLEDADDPGASCIAGITTSRMNSDLPAEAYWEWRGTLDSLEAQVKVDGKDKDTPFAKVSVQFQFADNGYEILCHRTGDNGVDWSIEARELLRSGDKWEPRAIVGAKPVRWTEPQDTEDEFRGWFSVQRWAGKLVVRLGEARKPVDQSKPEVVSPAAESMTIDLPANTEGGTIQLVVDQGIGRFRLKQR